MFFYILIYILFSYWITLLYKSSAECSFLLILLLLCLSSTYTVPALINPFSQCSSLLCPPPPPLPLFHLQPSINPYPPWGSPLRAAAGVFRASVDIGQHVRQISPTQKPQDKWQTRARCVLAGSLLVWLSCGQLFSTGDVLLREKKLTAKEGRRIDERKCGGRVKKRARYIENEKKRKDSWFMLKIKEKIETRFWLHKRL